MKKLTAQILLAALLLTGCSSQPVNPVGTETSGIPTETTILQDPETFLPSLTVAQGETICEARIGSYNWEIDSGDGTRIPICVDAVEPRDMVDSLPVLEANSPEVQLSFLDTPETVIAWCWENPDDETQSVSVEEGTLTLLPGSYVYQITACWPGSEGFTNIVHYSFRANAPVDG